MMEENTESVKDSTVTGATEAELRKMASKYLFECSQNIFGMTSATAEEQLSAVRLCTQIIQDGLEYLLKTSDTFSLERAEAFMGGYVLGASTEGSK